MTLDDDSPDLLDTLDHLDTEGSTVTLKSRRGEPVIIWVDDLNDVDAYLEGDGVK